MCCLFRHGFNIELSTSVGVRCDTCHACLGAWYRSALQTGTAWPPRPNTEAAVPHASCWEKDVEDIRMLCVCVVLRVNECFWLRPVLVLVDLLPFYSSLETPFFCISKPFCPALYPVSCIFICCLSRCLTSFPVFFVSRLRWKHWHKVRESLETCCRLPCRIHTHFIHWFCFTFIVMSLVGHLFRWRTTTSVSFCVIDLQDNWKKLCWNVVFQSLHLLWNAVEQSWKNCPLTSFLWVLFTNL